MSYRSEEEPLDTHLWFLCKLLIQSGHDLKSLQLYIIAACFVKIRRRMKNLPISKPYHNSLKNVTEFPKFTEAPKGTPKSQEAQSDNDLLTKVLPVLHRHIPHLPMSNLLSNLLRQGEAASAQASYDVYTEDTRIEFHTLLCELLKRFEESLDNLKTYHDKKDRLSAPSEFKSRLAAVLTYGTALQLIARGSMIEKHLKAIEPLLGDHRRDKTADIKLQTMTDERGEEVDVELERVRSTTHGTMVHPLWKSYRDWLRLMVVHFDAVAILAGHVASSSFQAKEISIKILSAPRPSQAMLSWENLLNSKHFPAHTPNTIPNAPLKDIIDSLKKWSEPEVDKLNTIETVLGAVKELLIPDSEEPIIKPAIRPIIAPAVAPAVVPAVAPAAAPAVAPAVEPPTELKQIIMQLKSLKNCQSPARDTCIEEVTATLSKLDPQSPQSQVLIREVIRLLESLRDGSVIFRKLRQIGLSKGIGFTGSLHCELVIASLIKLASLLETSSLEPACAAEYRNILNEFKVSRIVSALQDPSDTL